MRFADFIRNRIADTFPPGDARGNSIPKARSGGLVEEFDAPGCGCPGILALRPTWSTVATGCSVAAPRAVLLTLKWDLWIGHRQSCRAANA
jgi:hypothetical protein